MVWEDYLILSYAKQRFVQTGVLAKLVDWVSLTDWSILLLTRHAWLTCLSLIYFTDALQKAVLSGSCEWDRCIPIE